MDEDGRHPSGHQPHDRGSREHSRPRDSTASSHQVTTPHGSLAATSSLAYGEGVTSSTMASHASHDSVASNPSTVSEKSSDIFSSASQSPSHKSTVSAKSSETLAARQQPGTSNDAHKSTVSAKSSDIFSSATRSTSGTSTASAESSDIFSSAIRSQPLASILTVSAKSSEPLAARQQPGNPIDFAMPLGSGMSAFRHPVDELLGGIFGTMATRPRNDAREKESRR